jgi:hypothetical protein
VRDGAGRGGEVLGGVLGVDAALDRVAAQHDVLLGDRERLARAIRICSRTMSMPETSSVTQCSTCTRVFISRKKYSPSCSRPSIVPAEW